jgi:hypothetical protein
VFAKPAIEPQHDFGRQAGLASDPVDGVHLAAPVFGKATQA